MLRSIPPIPLESRLAYNSFDQRNLGKVMLCQFQTWSLRAPNHHLRSLITNLMDRSQGEVLRFCAEGVSF